MIDVCLVEPQKMSKMKDIRHRSRSLFTSHTAMNEESNPRDIKFVEGSVSLPNTTWMNNRSIVKSIYTDDTYTVSYFKNCAVY